MSATAGRRGLQVQVTPHDLVLATGATVAELGPVKGRPPNKPLQPTGWAGD